MRPEVISLANTTFEQAVRGGIGGVVATLPMTLLMEVGHRRLLRSQRDSLPPREITSELIRRAGASPYVNERGQFGLALGSHFAYGALSGAPFLAVTHKLKGPTIVRGMAYGLVLWAASYFGWLPALRMRASGSGQSSKSNLLMVTAHLLWGALLAAGASMLQPQGQDVAIRGLGSRRGSIGRTRR